MSALFEWIRRGTDGARYELLTLVRIGGTNGTWGVGIGAVTRAELELARRQAVREGEAEAEEAFAAALAADATLEELARGAEYLHDGWFPTVFELVSGEKTNPGSVHSAGLEPPRSVLDVVERSAGLGLTLTRVDDREVG